MPVFDTLTYAREMERAGFTREQAEALANGQAKLIDDRLTTKDDLAEVRTALTRDIDDLRKELRQTAKDLSADIKASQRETINRLGLLMLTMIGAATAILGFVSRMSH